MKPNFALTLSFEGIRLLHRSPSGWILVGEVPLDEPDLAGALAAMRATAVGLEPGGIRTKVMLPAEQVKVLEASAPGEAAALATLEGATPYPVADLAIDHRTVDGRHRVAAVARETLDEAEAFVAGHRFDPVSFAAVLPEDGFPGEAFFGETRRARAGVERVERDAEPTVPRASLHAGLRAGPGAAHLAVEAVAADPPGSGTLAAAPGAAAASPSEARAAGRAEQVPSGLAGPAGAPLSATGVPEPVFASRSRIATDRGGPVPLREIRRPPPGRGPSAPAVEAGDAARTEPPVRPPSTPRPGGLLPAPAPASAAAMPPVAPVTASTAPAADLDVAAARAASPQAAPVAPGPSARRDGEAKIAATPAGRPARPRGKPRFLGLALTAVLLLAMLAVGVLASSTPNGIAGLLGLVEGRAIAASSIEVPSPEPAPLADAVASGPAPVAEVAPAAPALDPGRASRAAAAVAAAIEALPEPEPVPAAAPGTPVSPEEGNRIYAATGVWISAPNPPSLSGLPSAEATPPTPAAVAATPSRAAPAPLIQVALDAGLGAPEDPPVPRPRPAAAASVVATTSPDTVAEARPRLPPTQAGEPPAAAPALAASGAPAALANAVSELPGQRPWARPTAPVLPDSMRVAAASAAAPEGAPPGQPEAAPAGLTAEALSLLPAPPTALAFAGPPAEEGAAAGAVGLDAFGGVRPPPRPAGLAPETPEALASFDGPRPGLRPDGLAPDGLAEAPAVAEGVPATDPEAIAAALAAAQAQGAPAATASPPAADPAEPRVDVQAALASIVAGGPDPLAGATRQAVAVARVPDARPRNFDSVVRDQLARTARAAEPAAAAPASSDPEEAESSGTEVAAAAAVPSGATAQSVAQAATFADVMALREVNLIGVFGQPSDRRALVRMGNGRYMRVGVGDSLDGGQVTAIGDNALNYTKRGRQLQLVIPGG